MVNNQNMKEKWRSVWQEEGKTRSVHRGIQDPQETQTNGKGSMRPAASVSLAKVFSYLSSIKIKIYQGGEKREQRKKMKLIIVHGYQHLRDFLQDLCPPYWHHISTGQRWEETLEQLCSSLAGRWKEEQQSSNTAGRKSNAGGLPRTGKVAELFKMAFKWVF